MYSLSEHELVQIPIPEREKAWPAPALWQREWGPARGLECDEHSNVNLGSVALGDPPTSDVSMPCTSKPAFTKKMTSLP